MVSLDLAPGKKLFFASDFHLGAPNYEASKERELRVVRWLDQIKEEAAVILLLGDIFDFWFDYKYVVPKGFIHFLSKMQELRDRGIKIIFFTGNHDMWMFDYFPRELGITVYYDPVTFEVGSSRIQVGHGDGLGSGEYVYKAIKKVFRNKLCQAAFAFLHPYLGFSIAKFWSKSSREKHENPSDFTLEKERLYHYCLKQEKTKHHDYYVFGHRHLPLELQLNSSSLYFNVGDWVSHSKFGVFDGQEFKLADFAE